MMPLHVVGQVADVDATFLLRRLANSAHHLVSGGPVAPRKSAVDWHIQLRHLPGKDPDQPWGSESVWLVYGARHFVTGCCEENGSGGGQNGLGFAIVRDGESGTSRAASRRQCVIELSTAPFSVLVSAGVFVSSINLVTCGWQGGLSSSRNEQARKAGTRRRLLWYGG